MKTRPCRALLALLFLAPVSSAHAAAIERIVALPDLSGILQSTIAINDHGDIAAVADFEGEQQRLIEITAGVAHDLGTLGDSSRIEVSAINNRGQIAGNVFYQDEHGFIFDHGTLTDVGPDSILTDINDRGNASGSLIDNGKQHGFILVGGSIYGFSVLDYIHGFSSSYATAINSSDVAVGAAQTRDGEQPIIYESDTLRNLGSPPAFGDTAANGINNLSQIVMTAVSGASNEPVFHAFLFDSNKASFFDLGTLGGSFSSAIDINDRVEIIGNSTASLEEDAPVRGFLFRDGMMNDLLHLLPPDSGWSDLYPQDINQNGQIVGTGQFNGQPRGFLITPATAIPLPAALWPGTALLAAIGLTSSLRRRGFLVGLFIAAGALPASAGAVRYRVVDLTPPGFANAQAQGISGGRVIGHGSAAPDAPTHALLWPQLTNRAIDLRPGSALNSYATGIAGAEIVGFEQSETTSRALVWHGGAESFDILAPHGTAEGIAGTDVVGRALLNCSSPEDDFTCEHHAAIWRNARHFIDLTPTGAGDSIIRGAAAGEQVGFAVTTAGTHAFLWHGSADSAVDLNPPGYFTSEALATSGSEQVGAAYPSVEHGAHATLWRGSAQSAVDLAPELYYSTATDVRNGIQVGYGGDQTADGFVQDRALLWRGTADSVVDLHQFLPPIFEFSIAYGIDDDGTIVGVGFTSHGDHALAWIPVASSIPLPAGIWPGLAMIFTAMAATSVRARCRAGNRAPSLRAA